MFNYVCSECGKKYSPKSLVFKCTCEGMLDIEEQKFNFNIKDILLNEWSIFRYLKVLPFQDSSTSWKDISMGEGLTSLVPLDNETPNVLLKMDFMMPTLSFKDRGAAVLIAKAKELGVKKVVQDSSGNAGNAIAAYSARAGISCDIYVPEGTSKKKVEMIRSHGATVNIVSGNREDTAKAALKAAEEKDCFYASHVYNPLFYQGTKTYVYEIFEQSGGTLPENFIVPVGNGTLLLGCYYAFRELLNLGLITTLPRIIAVQSAHCAPIYKAFSEKKERVREIQGTPTLAEGIAIAAPMRGTQILEAIRVTHGDIILAPEEGIISARDFLAKKGFYVELTTAATMAGFLNYDKTLRGKSVIPLCGAGLKSGK